jgi:hypothetical protein
MPEETQSEAVAKPVPEVVEAPAEAPAATKHPEDWAVAKGLLVLEKDSFGELRVSIRARVVLPWKFCAARQMQNWPNKRHDDQCPMRKVDPDFAITESEFDAAIVAVG